MFGKTLLSATVALALALQASAHAAVNPPLGVASGTAVRNDVQRPNGNCGGVDVASTLDASKSVALAADGTFTVTAANFNAGQDGSLQFTAAVDPTGTGASFTPATVVTNGDKAPTSVTTAQLKVQLPAGTVCKGGKAGNLCLVSFVSAGGFGNCVSIAGPAAAAAPPPPAASSAAAAPPAAASSAAAAPPAAATTAAAPPAAAAAGAAGAAGAAAAAGAKGQGRKGHRKGGKKAAAAAAAAGGAAGAGAGAGAAAAGAKAAGARSVPRRRLVEQ